MSASRLCLRRSRPLLPNLPIVEIILTPMPPPRSHRDIHARSHRDIHGAVTLRHSARKSPAAYMGQALSKSMQPWRGACAARVVAVVRSLGSRARHWVSHHGERRSNFKLY
jgi:hypothetical protein